MPVGKTDLGIDFVRTPRVHAELNRLLEAVRRGDQAEANRKYLPTYLHTFQ